MTRDPTESKVTDLAGRRLYSIYGLTLESDYPFRSPLVSGEGQADLRFSVVKERPVAEDVKEWVCLAQGPGRLRTGEPSLLIYAHCGYQVMRFSRAADFYLWPDRIVARLLNPSLSADIEIAFLGVVLAYWLEQRGLIVLHASAAVTRPGAIGFLATKEGGKTSLAAALVDGGGALLTDDLLAVRADPKQSLAMPGYPQMRMWPHVAEHFLGHYRDLPRVHPRFNKRRAPLGEGGLGPFCLEPARLACLYLPRRIRSQTSVSIEALSDSEAVIDLVRNSFTPHLVQTAELQRVRLQRLAQLVGTVPVRVLVYPDGLEHLTKVCAAITSDTLRERR